LGILLFEMLTGEPPFFSGNRQKLQNKIIKDKLKLPAWLTSEASTLVKGVRNLFFFVAYGILRRGCVKVGVGIYRHHHRNHADVILLTQ
jgi:serine/threonine protein kinase